jgi:phosphoenolpyruvate carboxykinase (ATP)
MYHFISGYISRVPGYEGSASTFGASFGQPFLVLHPTRYAHMLAERISRCKTNAWLINTGCIGGSVERGGGRCPLGYTRAVLEAIQNGTLKDAKYEKLDVFNLDVPVSCTGVPSQLLHPAKAWQGSAEEFRSELNALAGEFQKNFEQYHDQASSEIIVLSHRTLI